MSDNQAASNRPTWEAESQHPELCQQLIDGLREVRDPEIGMDVIQLGLIRDVHIDKNSALVNMILTTPYCPYGPTMLESVREKTERVLGRSTRVSLDMTPWDYSMMEDGASGEWGMF